MVPNAASAISGRSDSPSSEDFFSFGYNDEHQTITRYFENLDFFMIFQFHIKFLMFFRYVQQIVTGTFDHSTDSETDDDHSNPEMPPLE